MQSFSEFASSEFAVFEFAYERGAVNEDTEYRGQGSSTALFSGVTVSNSAFSIQGFTAPLSLQAQTVINTVGGLTKGIAEVAFFGASLRSGDMRSTCISDSYFDVGYIVDSSIDTGGTSLFDARSVDPETLDIQGRAVVRFFTGYKQATSLNSAAISTTSFPAWSTSESKITPVGSAEVKFFLQYTANTFMRGDAAAQSNLRANPIVYGDLVSSGIAASNLKIQSVKLCNFWIISAATGSFSGRGLAVGTASMPGSATVDWNAQYLRQTYLMSAGSSETIFRQGSPIIQDMPYAWDVVIRPYEVREVTWK